MVNRNYLKIEGVGDFFNLEPGFYIVHRLLAQYDTFEEFGWCQNNCIFCSTPAPRNHGENRSSIINKKDNIILCSGEPTNLKDIIKKVKDLKGMYDVVSLTTNGRKLKNINFTKSLFQAGLDEIFFSLHGHIPKINDKLTGIKGSFDETVRGIQNTIRVRESDKYNIRVAATFVLTKSNIHSLYKFLLFLNKLKIETVNFNTLLPLGLGKSAFKKEMPSYTEILSEFNKLKNRCSKNHNLDKFRIFLSTLPFCMVKNVNENMCYTFLLNKAGEFKDLRHRACGYICEDCNLNPYCEGIFKDYVKIYGLDEFGIFEKQ